MLIVLLNVFSSKESSTREYCILICELSYTNPFLQQRRLQQGTQGTDANLQQRGLAADVSLTWFLNRLSFCCLSAGLLYADWSLTKSRTRLSRQFY
jgi:hypothetical protein